MPSRNKRKDSVDGVVSWKCAVVDDEVTFEALGNVVPAAAGLDHGGEVVDVDDGAEVSRLFQTVETLHLHQLTKQLVCHLSSKIYLIYWIQVNLEIN